MIKRGRSHAISNYVSFQPGSAFTKQQVASSREKSQGKLLSKIKNWNLFAAAINATGDWLLMFTLTEAKSVKSNNGKEKKNSSDMHRHSTLLAGCQVH